jgi:hypothetical protein
MCLQNASTPFSSSKTTYFMKMAVFWVVAPCSMVEVKQHSRGPCCLHHQGALMIEAARTSETLVNFYQTTRRYNHQGALMVEAARTSETLVNFYQTTRRYNHQGALMMEAARTSETLVNFYQTTRRYNPEDSHLRTHRRENPKFYLTYFMFQ